MASAVGLIGVQFPTRDRRLFDLEKAGTSKDYCAEVKGMKALGLTEIMRAW